MNSNPETTNKTRRKKNPKDMSIEELEDYIQKNRTKNPSVPTESRSWNTSFQSNHNFGFFSLNSKPPQNTQSTNTNPPDNESQPLCNNQTEKDISITSNALHQTQPSSEHTRINTNIFQSNNIDKDSKSKIINSLITGVVNNSPYNITSSSRNNSRNNTISRDNEDSQAVSTLNSKAATSYVKSLQDRIKQWTNQNEEWKLNRFNSNMNRNTGNSGGWEEEINKLKAEIKMKNENIFILESEKARHLEQNAVDKEQYVAQINEWTEELNKIKAQFEGERMEMVETMTSWREIIYQKESEKNEMMNQYERILQEQSKQIESLSKGTNSNAKPRKPSTKAIRPMKVNERLTGSNCNASYKASINGRNTGINTNKSVEKKVKNKKKKSNNNNINNNNNNTKAMATKGQCAGKAQQQNNQYTNPQEGCANQKETNINTWNENFAQYHENNVIKNIHISELNSLRSDYSGMNVNMNPNGDLYQPQPAQQITSKYNNNNSNNNNILLNNRENIYIDDHDHNTHRYEDRLKQINENIFAIERNIPELVRDYKNIISRLNSNIFPEDTTTWRNNWNMLTQTIEEHKTRLNELKEEQQELLKGYIAWNGNYKDM